jgi:hypothetical protein
VQDVVHHATLALTKALWAVAPSVLPRSQKAQYAINYAARKMLGPDAVQPFQPSFAAAANHFVVHAGEQQ